MGFKVLLLVDLFTSFLDFLANFPLAPPSPHPTPPPTPSLIMSFISSDVVRDGFRYGLEGFRTHPGLMERIEVSELRGMFLPNLSDEAHAMLKKYPSLVRCQLKHYGVDFDEREFYGRGSLMFKRILQKGECERVPRAILDLEAEMREEWLETCTLAQLSSHPDLVMQKYFLSDGWPDHTKMTTVLEISFLEKDKDLPSQMIEAASKVAGLHCQQAPVETLTVFIGWNAEDVANASREYSLREYQKVQDMSRQLAAQEKQARELADRERERIEEENFQRVIEEEFAKQARELADRERERIEEENFQRVIEEEFARHRQMVAEEEVRVQILLEEERQRLEHAAALLEYDEKLQSDAATGKNTEES